MIERLGSEVGERILVHLLYVTEDPGNIPFEDILKECIVNPDQGSGWSIKVDLEHRIPREKIITESSKWLHRNYGRSKMEWAYNQVRPLIMVEKLFKDRSGILAPNCKFFIFHGKVKLIDLFYDHFKMKAFYKREFRELDARRRDSKYAEVPKMPRPVYFEEMISISEKLEEELDFVRVDLYNVDGNVYFGEFTIYQASGLGPCDPKEFDREPGPCCKLNMRYYVRNIPGRGNANP